MRHPEGWVEIKLTKNARVVPGAERPGLGIPNLRVGGFSSKWRIILEALGRQRLGLLACAQDLRPGIGVSSALAARTGSKYSLRNAILPSVARRKTT